MKTNMSPKWKLRKNLPSYRLVQTALPAQSLAYILTVIFFLSVLILLYVPWQQTTMGFGRVVAYAPLDRQQVIESPISGRVVKWHVHEGTRVKKGDPIIDISDNDPNFITRIREERNALLQRLEAARSREDNIRSRILSLRSSMGSAVSAADSRRMMAKDRVRASEQAVDAAKAALKTANLNLDRQKQLWEKGLTSKRTLELAELDHTNAETGLDRARAAYDAAVKEERALNSDTGKVQQDAEASINDAKASLASAQSEVARVLEDLPKLEARLSRQENQEVFAPRDGTIMRILVNPDTQQVKEGDGVAILVPDAEDKAVELFISGNDIPLVGEGRKVRLQFQGYPVLQISGWPETAVGTFGGVVKLVDITDNGSGNFRVLVVPDNEDRQWPSSRYLRQGVRAKGWIFLNRVSVGYELWRRFNDFPPNLPMDDPEMKSLLDENGGGEKSK
ncbi:HlyD family efflux transporter periplasmic adaptor subunit [Leptospira levettii]|uniref:HlyD family secretion protein n=2 Tax=Leptospira levettii TaxID=2023178 RepID=A0A5F2D982_9LEPT|nr:HlyD family efflux transporter periplasmic adaptor subunit [Leptospira levettii]MCG6147466.1 HlyD family secretion protein [Leptospira levettii]MCW7465255.1 HlyD family secretion protein [Leptospira levettii]MCW7496095.1 HlyD family secretion protein [Leptospira levettii]MCW7507531.1 HlyD family secretion protein [Leptospira levettii]MCW7509995.1 HlyD family secretion protein [Leptospira levettii]